MKKQKTYILTLEKDDPKKEMEFEIAFQLSLSAAQRYRRMQKMFGKTITRKKHDHQKTSEIISRV